MKRFVYYVPNYDGWGDRIDVVSKINEYAEENNLTIVTISPIDHGIYVVFEKGGE